MATVNTVLGPVDTDDLGFTLSHEHVGANAGGRRHTYPEFIDRDGIREQSIAAMRAVRTVGNPRRFFAGEYARGDDG